MKVLLTNDDGIHAEGLQTLRRALVALADVELLVVAPDGERSAMARSITTRRPLWVEEVPFGDGTVGYACDGTPVDCVRLAFLGVDGSDQPPELIVSGINHGINAGDDITYSGTVAAALEGVVLGIPAIAASQDSARGPEGGWSNDFDFAAAAAFVARVVERADDVPLPRGTLLNVNVPAGEVLGVEVAPLGRRVYEDRLEEVESDGARTRYRIYGYSPPTEDTPGTDIAALLAGRIAVTPLHFDLTAEHGLDALRAYDLAALIGPAAEEVGESSPAGSDSLGVTRLEARDSHD